MEFRYIKQLLLLWLFLIGSFSSIGQKSFIKDLKKHQTFVYTSPEKDTALLMMKNEDAFYYNYDEYYYYKKDIAYITVVSNQDFYNNYEINNYKVTNFNLKILTPYSLHSKTYFSSLHDKQEEIIEFDITVIKPDGRRFATTPSQLKEIALGLYSDEDFEEYLISRVPAIHLEVGDVINYFIITKSHFNSAQQSVMFNKDYPVVNRTLHFYIDNCFSWQYKTINCEKKGTTISGLQYSELHYDVNYIKGIQNKPYIDLSSATSVILTLNTITFYHGYLPFTYKLIEEGYGVFCSRVGKDIENRLFCVKSEKELFGRKVDSILSAVKPENLVDTLQGIQQYLNGALRLCNMDTGFINKKPQYQFNHNVITLENVVLVYAAILVHLNLNAYICYGVPRQMGKLNSSFYYKSPFYKIFLAVRKGQLEWYYLNPPTAEFKYKVDFMPYYMENSGFVGIKLNRKKKDSPEWIVDRTRNFTAAQNIEFSKMTIQLGDAKDPCTIETSRDYSGQTAFYQAGYSGSFWNAALQEKVKDSVGIYSDIFVKYGQLPDQLKILSDTNPASGRYKTITVSMTVPSMMYPLGDSLYFIPFERLVKYRDLQNDNSPADFNIDLGFPFLQRSDIEIKFPWAVKLENASQYPLINSSEIGKIQFSILQTEERTIRILAEISLNEHLIPKHNYRYIQNFNGIIYKMLANSLVVKRV
jgi:hypothetical protein